MSSLGLYRPGRSFLHRAQAAGKLLGMVLAGVASVFVGRVWEVAVALALVVGGYVLARIPVRAALAQLRPLLWLLAFVAVFQALVVGWERAVVVVGVIAVLVLLAALVTLTTRTAAMVEVVVAGCRPLRVLGADPERVGLLLALGVRSVPVVVALASEVRDAQRARGLSASPRAFAVPLLVRALRHADALGDALVARGIDD
jgi:biotin transport system permease protein